MHNSLINHLIEHHISVSTMESCTSGLIAAIITDTPGASAIFPGGYVTYSNEAKIMAGVPPKVISDYGVYSPQTAEAMARTTQNAFHTDIAIGITGSTGNVDPNNPDSVVGEVYFCIIYASCAHSYHYSTNTENKSRHDIKQEYANELFSRLAEIINV